MTEVSVKTCFTNSKVLSLSLNSWLACWYQDPLKHLPFKHFLSYDTLNTRWAAKILLKCIFVRVTAECLWFLKSMLPQQLRLLFRFCYFARQNNPWHLQFKKAVIRCDDGWCIKTLTLSVQNVCLYIDQHLDLLFTLTEKGKIPNFCLKKPPFGRRTRLRSQSISGDAESLNSHFLVWSEMHMA